MFRLIISSVRHNRSRYTATLIAIITGVAFYAATGFVSDRVIDSLEGDVNRQYGNVDVAVVAEESASSTAVPATISGKQADALTALPGVEGSAGSLVGATGFVDAQGKPYATDAAGRLWITDDQLNPLQISSGRAPAKTGEIAVDRGLADRQKLKTGDQVTVLTLAGNQPATIVGITHFAKSDALDDGGTVSVPEAAAFDWLSNGHRVYQEYYLRGADPDALRTAAAKIAPTGFTALSGDEFRAEKRESVGSFGQVLKQALQAFAILALLVGGFVIYNTFTVIVAQRLRELAVLAAIGATGKQLKRSLRYEGLVIGLVGSILGVVAGLGLTFVLIGALTLFGVSLPGSGLVLTPSNVISGIFLGTIITVLSVMIPARRAARTEPIEAMRSAAVESVKLPVRRGVTAAVLGLLGLAAMLLGTNAGLIGLGVVLFVAAVLIGGPHIASIGARLARPLLSRFGIEGRLAVDNSVRNPKRTAATANALVIGVFLVTLVAVVGTTVKDFAVGQLATLQSADYLVISDGGTVDAAFVDKLSAVKDVEQVVPFQRQAVSVDSTPGALSTGDIAALRQVANIQVSSGSLDKLGPGTIAVPEDDKTPHRVGSTVTVTNDAGTSTDLRVVAVIGLSLDSGVIGNLVDQATFTSIEGDVAPTAAFVDTADGAQTETKEAIQTLADLRPDITVTPGNQLGQTLSTVFDFIINAVTGLLLMSVLVALIGIINTMSLSILERRRELGLLRIIGTTDDRVKRMIRLEAVLISLLGTLTGLVAGVIVSLCVTVSINRLTNVAITPHAPFIEIVVILVAGVVLGFVAALLPARRSTRMSPLEAVQAT
ncbi:ABC transporter permease [Cellulomonas sp. PhB150]|uniref:ABC transporter permease n=1 Tax=Cellulomonas sp. PhB150 TaxID=2485188 RepID=UPI000F47EB95|nr:FtsX-like permease family protein [Cellulomonas sp. PhB150]ROS31087.1 putative ABC transport system permease protein [Cellulomonas sp. PhB150]